MKRIFILILIPMVLISAADHFSQVTSKADSVLVFEDFESGTDSWTLNGNWGLDEGNFMSGTHSLTESPGGNYTSDENSSAVWKDTIDLSVYDDAYISFWIKYDIEADFDYMFFEVSDDNGVNWTTKKTWTGIESEWSKETVSLLGYAGYSQVTFRFVFSSDQGLEADGMYIDDIILQGVIIEPSPLPVIHKGPELYEAELDENDFSYTSSLEIVDFSNRVDSVWIEYCLDLSETVLSVPAVNIHDYVWEFTIPDYGPGVQIDYRICMTDSLLGNLTGSTTYSYISGDHRIYDSGIVSYYKLIENNQAMAVKISTEIYAPTGLVYALIRNYKDTDHVSADMKFHVWADNGGVPGEDLIEPFIVTPEASFTNTKAFTRIDLRSYYLPMSGDFWIGISAFEGSVYSLMEDPYEEGTTAYERSYSGSWTGTEWSWSPDVDYNYHFRAIMAAPDGIEEDLTLPALTELHQNYPNPFNPVTQIRFSLAKTAQVRLSVYNIAGQLVLQLESGVRQAGINTVDFDGSRFNSGVYYYTLETDGKALTRKMLLIK
ncbi:MAG: T9SS type A sorting domain-containing protein [Candidatus Delongbacteria bacterium]|nr:T9SS type A sorting domain-containing protein [Candidatus Delongbacteria bacterium]